MDAATLPAGSRQGRLTRARPVSSKPRRSGKAERAAPVPRHCGAPLRTTIHVSLIRATDLMFECGLTFSDALREAERACVNTTSILV